MQQFFDLVNALLSADGAAAARRLRIATYKVCAFSAHAGIMQFCEGSMSLNDYLIGPDPHRPAFEPGAHVRHARPGELAHSEIAHAVHATCTKSRGNKGKWEELYDKVVARFPPVMRHFFTERYHEPALWCAPPTDTRYVMPILF